MGDLIRIIQDFFNLIVDFITNTIEGIGTLIETLMFLSGASNQISVLFPGFLVPIFVCSLTLLIVLRIIGR